MTPSTFFIQNTNDLLDQVYALQDMSTEVSLDLQNLISRIVNQVEKIIEEIENK